MECKNKVKRKRRYYLVEKKKREKKKEVKDFREWIMEEVRKEKDNKEIELMKI